MSRVLKSIVTLLCLFCFAGCGRGFLLVDTAALEVEAKLPFDPLKIPEESRDTVRITLEIPGLVGESTLELKEQVAGGTFVLDVAKQKAATAVVRIYGAIAANRPHTLLAIFRKQLKVTPGAELLVKVAASDFDSSQDNNLVLDANGNGSSNLNDLLGRPELAGSDGRPCDPAEPQPFVGLSTTDLQFPSGIGPGEYARQIVVLENLSDADLVYTAGIIDAPGVSVGRIAASETSGNPTGSGHLEVLSLEETTLPMGEIALLSVAFSPASNYLATGVLQIAAQDRCAVTISGSVRLIANVGTDLQPTDDDYTALSPADIPAVGSYGAPDIISADSLFSGQQFSVAVDEGTEEPEVSVDGHPADRVFAVKVPAQHSLAVITSQLYADVDLAILALDSSGNTGQDKWTSANLGLSTEALSIPFLDETRVLIVVGRKRGQTGAEAPDPDSAFAMSAHLVGAPRFTAPPDPAEDELFGGAHVTLSGENFAPNVQVLFGTAAATDVVVSDQGRTITCTAPQGELDFGKNPATLTVENLSTGFIATLPQAFLYLPGAPSVVAVTPNVISTAGQTPVTIVGTDFADRFGTPRVLFGEEPAMAVNYVNATRLEVLSPAVPSAGPVDVTVQNLRPNNTFVEGTLTNGVEYQTPSSPAPTLAAVHPSEADVRGGTIVTLDGTGFMETPLVYFGGTASPSVTLVSATELQATVPPGSSAGLVDLVVINPDAQATSQAVQFLYTPPAADPVLLGVSPLAIHAAIAGDGLTLLGDDLGPEPYPSAVSIVASDGISHYAASLDSVGTSAVRIVLVDALPAAEGYRAQLIYAAGHTVRSPPFSAVAPQIFGPEVISGLAQEGQAFGIAINGAMLNPSHVRRIVFDDGGDPVEVEPTILTESLVHATVVAGLLVQGTYSVGLRYDNGYTASSPLNLQVAGECNNGVKNSGEQCDTQDFGSDSCATLGFVDGQLACTSACTFDTTGCHRCGNQQVDEGEQCDDTNLDGQDCPGLGYDDGVLLCTASCTFDATGCSDCGNGIVESPYEVCDNNQLGGVTCSSLNFTDGTVTCSQQCTLDTTDCYTCGDTLCSLNEDNSSCPADCPVSCGDGSCEGNETCINCPTDCQVCQPFHGVVQAGGGQSGTVFSILAQPIEVSILDSNDQPAQGVTVTVTPPLGGWVLYDPVDGISDHTGLVRATVGMGGQSGAMTISIDATSPDGTDIQDLPTTIGATVADVPAGTIFTLVNRSGSAGSALDPQGAAVRTALNDPQDLAWDSDGNLYIADSDNNRVLKVDNNGVATLFAGNGAASNEGDGGPAVEATLRQPTALAVDNLNRVYMTSYAAGNGYLVRRVNENGIIENFAGGGPDNSTDGDGGFRTSAYFSAVSGMAVDPANNDLWVAESDPVVVRLRHIDGSTGMVGTHLTKSTTYDCVDGVNTVSINKMGGLLVDPQDRIIVSFGSNYGCGTTGGSKSRLWQRESNGLLRPLLDQEAAGASIARDGAGTLFYVDSSGDTVGSVDHMGTSQLVAGTGIGGFSGDFGEASAAQVNDPGAVAISPSGDLAILDRSNHAVRIVRSIAQSTASQITLNTVSGDAQSSKISRPLIDPMVVSANSGGSPVAGVNIQFSRIELGSVVEPDLPLTNSAGEVTVYGWVGMAAGDYRFSAQVVNNYGELIGTALTLTATATTPQAGDVLVLVNDLGIGPGLPFALPWPATKANLRISDDSSQTNTPLAVQVAVAPATAVNAGSLFFPEHEGHRVIGVTALGEAYVVAGTGEGFGGVTGSYHGDGGPGALAGLDNPRGVAVDSTGRVFIADSDNHVVRVVTTDGDINNFAGGALDSSDHGDGLRANAANLEHPSALAIGPNDDLYILEGHGSIGRCRVRRVDGITGFISTVWKNDLDACGNCASNSNLTKVYDISVDASGQVFLGGRITVTGGHNCNIPCVGDCRSDTLFKLDGLGGMQGVYEGEAAVPAPQLIGVAGHPSDNSVLFGDGYSIKRRASDGTVTLVTGQVSTGGFLPVDTTPGALLDRPVGLTFDSSGNLYFVDSLYRVRTIAAP